MAPLDWGLGHATRCIPLIRELRRLGCEVLIGAEGKHAALLQQEFPDVTVLPLEGYRITYASSGSDFGRKMLQQAPRIYRAARKEHRWLLKMVPLHRIDAVISDNRFGLHHSGIPAVIMTHQLLVKSPYQSWTEAWLQRLNYFAINKFRACWVVDCPGTENLAGALSHPRRLPKRPEYLGLMSRFEYRDAGPSKYRLLVLLSGPEPQRSLLERQLVAQLLELDLPALLVGGEPGTPYDRMLTSRLRQVNHLKAAELNEALLQSDLVITRSGYTSVMDLVKLRRKAVFVPTPGQTEQEYLGSYLMEQGYFPCLNQDSFTLRQALELAGSFPFRSPEACSHMDLFREILHRFVGSL